MSLLLGPKTCKQTLGVCHSDLQNVFDKLFYPSKLKTSYLHVALRLGVGVA